MARISKPYRDAASREEDLADLELLFSVRRSDADRVAEATAEQRARDRCHEGNATVRRVGFVDAHDLIAVLAAVRVPHGDPRPEANEIPRLLGDFDQLRRGQAGL